MLTIREVVRDENGKLDNLVQWIWWTSELTRRMLRDYWVHGKWNPGQRGHGGVGCVAIIDAAGAGYRNIVSAVIQAGLTVQEVELLPVLNAIGPKNFPGTVDAAYVVNAGWTQRSLWKVVQKVVPKSAMEKLTFLDGPVDVDNYFDPDRLPKGAFKRSIRLGND